MDKEEIAKEFEDFVYIVSHDMAAPQRHIREFTKLLLASIDTPETPLNDEQKMFRDFIDKALVRIDKMQDALLAFSRVNSHVNDFQPFQSDECIQNVLRDIDDQLSEKQAKISVPDMSYSLMGDKEQIRQVFCILLNNAMIYVPKDVRPDVRISVRDTGDRIEFSVTDNGIGIRDEHTDKIFGMFRKLHAADAYGDGAGAGLAIARKIIRRHGGELTVQSEFGKGSCFTFSVQKA